MAYPVSVRWERSLRSGFTPLTRVDVRIPGEGTILTGLPVSSGSITFDRTAQVRASGNLLIPDARLFPALNAESILSPHGAELVIHSGMMYPEGRLDVLATGTYEVVPLGVFGIQSIKASEAGGNLPTIQFFDRFKSIERSSFVAPVDYGGQLIQDVIEDIILEAAPFYPGTGVEWTVAFDAALENFALPHGTIMDKPRAEFLADLGKSLGADIYFDRVGNAQVVPVPGIFAEDVGTIPTDWSIYAGEPDGNLIDASREWTNEGVHNGVIIVGSGDGDRPAPSAFVIDNNPDSPTYWAGPFGKSVLREEDSNLTTVLQCGVRARARLRDVTGIQTSTEVTLLPNVAMDPGDVLGIEFPSGGSEVRMLDSYTYDFRGGASNPGTRAVQYVPPEEV